MYWQSRVSDLETGGVAAYIDTWYGSNASYSTNKATQERYPLRTLRINSLGRVTSTWALLKTTQVSGSSNVILLFDGNFPHQENPNRLSLRHAGNRSLNALFLDGHAQSVASAELPTQSGQFTDPVQANLLGQIRWRVDIER
jgi:prepilin-type processing-associated H-X9-DG protein